jgi:hypothetical protein
MNHAITVGDVVYWDLMVLGLASIITLIIGVVSICRDKKLRDAWREFRQMWSHP